MQYNVNNPAVKRILREVKEMEAEPSDQYHANPLEDNIFEWHFTIRGPKDTEFEGGLYHGRILLPPEYPFKPPNIVLLNESGRFEVGTKICLSISSYHPEHWQPSWSIRTVLVALISFMPSKGDGAIGALDAPAKDRKALALKTPSYFCNKCAKRMSDILPPVEVEVKTEATQEPTTTATTTTTTSTEANTTTPATVSLTKETVTNSGEDRPNENPIIAPIPAQPTTSTPLIPVVQPTSPPPTSPPPIVHANILPPQPIAQGNVNLQQAIHFVHNQPVQPTQQQQQTQQVQQHIQQANHSSDTANLDYMIVALLIAIIGLLAKKFCGL